jgi:hypothetical protein
MTLPDERYRALKCGYEFLLELVDPKKTPKVPKKIRQRAHHVLRHYPTTYYFEMIAEKLPEHFDTKPFMVRLQERNMNDPEFNPPPETA